MSVIMELMKRFDLSLAMSDYISEFLLLVAGCKVMIMNFFLSFLGGECFVSHAMTLQ